MTRAVPAALLWGATLAALALLRLPYLASPGYILDGDEAVLGLMARRMAAGTEWPLYFAGQNYGLALFETVPAALAFRLFGESSRVLALSVLAVFLAGLGPLARALARLSGSDTWGRLLAVGLALAPGWVVWSMKARGLYVSGFLLAACALALITREDPGRRQLLGFGFLLGLIGLVQPLWLTVTVPFLLVGPRTGREWLTALVPAGIVWGTAFWVAPTGEAFWQPTVLGPPALDQLGLVPPLLIRAFSGRVVPHEPGAIATVIGLAATLLFFLLVVALAADVLRRRSRWAPAVCVAMVASVLHVVFFAVWVPRYFLPTTVLVSVAAATWLGGRAIRPRGVPLLAAVALLTGLAASATRLGRVPAGSPGAAPPAEVDLAGLVQALEADGVRGVYTVSGHVQWQVLFYGQERFPTRGRTADDRYPEFPRAVREASRRGEPLALVGELRAPLAYVGEARELDPARLAIDTFPAYRVGLRYLRVDDPPPLLLEGLGFELERAGPAGPAGQDGPGELPTRP